MAVDPARFAHLTFDEFRDLARDQSLTRHEKIGFPDSYREGKTGAILADITTKLPALEREGARVLDIGPGCGELALSVIDQCRRRNQRLVLIDSDEMLSQLPDEAGLTKIRGRFPADCAPLLPHYRRSFDAILVYSVLHYVMAEGDAAGFLDAALDLLDHGGALLIGDVPNASMRARFFASPAGVRFHQAFTGRADDPPHVPAPLHDGGIDDAAVVALMVRARQAGFDAYVLPQGADLPMANRREDLLCRRP